MQTTSDAEAGDVIATPAASCPSRDVLISSMDQDYYQLLRDAGPGHGSVRVLNTARRAGSRLADPAEVRAKHGVDPAQFADYRALAGDQADNIPGVAGVGAKTAAALLDDGPPGRKGAHPASRDPSGTYAERQAVLAPWHSGPERNWS